MSPTLFHHGSLTTELHHDGLIVAHCQRINAAAMRFLHLVHAREVVVGCLHAPGWLVSSRGPGHARDAGGAGGVQQAGAGMTAT